MSEPWGLFESEMRLTVKHALLLVNHCSQLSSTDSTLPTLSGNVVDKEYILSIWGADDETYDNMKVWTRVRDNPLVCYS